MPAASTTPPSFRPDVEGLRAIAVAVVVLFHAGAPGFGGGFIGVDVFFVISGFLITRLLLDERDRASRIDLVRFYARRARRLVPAALVAIAATAILFARQDGLKATALAALTFTSNLHFIEQSHAYFDAGVARDPLLHTWSLGVEAQFYLFWPFLFFAARRWFAPAAAVLVAMSAAGAVALTFSNQPLAFYSTLTRIWELGTGALLAALPAAKTHRFHALIGAMGLGLIACATVLFAAQTSYPGWAAFLPVAGAAATLVGASAPGPARSLLTSPPLQWLGKLSYSFYLWHWPLIVWVRGRSDTPLALAGAVLAALVLAIVSRRFIEQPTRAARALAKPATALICAALATAATAALVLILE